MLTVKEELLQNNEPRQFSSHINKVDIGAKKLNVLAAQEGNVTSLHFKKDFSSLEHNNFTINIDYCDSAVNLLCAAEEISYDVIFIDYYLEGVDLCALLNFIAYECPNTKVVVTSAPVWDTQSEKDQITSLCNGCYHEDFYELNVESFI